jgi:flagellar protein FlbD
MIPLTRLNSHPFVVNAELIKFIESTPDTMITLTTGERLIVRETETEVIRKVIEYGRMLRSLLEPS